MNVESCRATGLFWTKKKKTTADEASIHGIQSLHQETKQYSLTQSYQTHPWIHPFNQTSSSILLGVQTDNTDDQRKYSMARYLMHHLMGNQPTWQYIRTYTHAYQAEPPDCWLLMLQEEKSRFWSLQVRIGSSWVCVCVREKDRLHRALKEDHGRCGTQFLGEM